MTRAEAREALAARRFDLLVIGGGIVGAGIAWAATRNGLSVALVERDDFAGHTSSASSKLLHGGLRYLALGDVRLVREAHRERIAHMRFIAPHLVRPQPFVLPLYRDGPVRPLTMRAGLLAYSALSAFADGRSRVVSASEAARLVPALQLAGLRGAGLYSDAQTNDARLVVAALSAAADRGALVLNHIAVVGLRLAAGRVVGADLRDGPTGEELGVSARVVVNATGPWVDVVRRLERPAAPPSMRLSKGAHVVLDHDGQWAAAVTTPLRGDRVAFAIPWEGMLLLGTTDEPYEGDPGDVRVEQADIDQIIGEAATSLMPATLDRSRIRSSFAGLRVLPVGSGGTASARRETVVSVGPAGMVSVAGGKLTTWRAIGLQVLEAVAPQLGLRRVDRTAEWLPDAVHPTSTRFVKERLRSRQPDVPGDVLDHLIHLYGVAAWAVLDLVEGDPTLLARVHPDGPDIAAQVAYAAAREWAVTVDDALRRRTTVAVRGLDDARVRAEAERLLGACVEGAGR